MSADLDFPKSLNQITPMAPARYDHILIAGPTASGKSALALRLAERLGGTVVNADALQVYARWSVLTARPPQADLIRAPHALYGHVAAEVAYSAGHWLREVSGLDAKLPLIFTGGTGLYLSSLLRGLADIPEIPPDVRSEGDLLRASGLEPFLTYLEAHDPELLARVDRSNGMRLQRAWEVHRATGTALSAWQAKPHNPLVSRDKALCLVLNADPAALAERIAMRFAQMLDAGVLQEVAAQREGWDPALPSSRALGAAELMAHLEGRLSLEDAVEKAVITSRQYAKRQRTWFRSNMGDWDGLDALRDPLEQALKLI
ncbi:MAG: tRNA (adenosine(37)-N6)-dimethylallyltransferase MiaA [Pseudomonadota bacterium]